MNARSDTMPSATSPARRRNAREAFGRASVGLRTASWDFSPRTLKIVREMGLALRLLADGRRRALRAARRRSSRPGSSNCLSNGSATTPPISRWTACSQRCGPIQARDAVLSIFLRELDVAYEEGGLFLLTMHPHHSGHRSRIFHSGRGHSPGQGEGQCLVCNPRRVAPLLRRIGRPPDRPPRPEKRRMRAMLKHACAFRI